MDELTGPKRVETTGRSEQGDRPTTKRASRRSPRRGKIKLVASSLLFQSTALAGTMAGIPMAFYARAYAQATCNPSSTDSFKYPKNVGGILGIASTTFDCTISSSSTITSTQYAYGGALTWYSNPENYKQKYPFPPTNGEFGLNIKVTNTATIDVSEAARVSPMISFEGSYLYGTNYYHPILKHDEAIRVISVGGNSDYSTTKTDKMPNYPGGPGGSVSVTNSGPIKNAPGAGIYAVSAGGSPYDNADGGSGGSVSVTTTADISTQGFGIVAISRGGASGSSGTGGAGGTVAVTVSGDVGSITSTATGGGVLAASYGGNSPNNGSWYGGLQGGIGGHAGEVTLTVGSSATPFAGSVTTTAPGKVGKEWGFLTRNSGAALAAISYGGQGLVTTNGSGVGFNGGDGDEATLKIYGTSDTLVKTSGDYSVGILAGSYGGTSLDYYDASKSGGGADKAAVSLSGGGTIETAGHHSSGIVAVSLGGLGKLSSTATSDGAGKGGVAGEVEVTNDFAITTKGDHSHGIAAISAGAGGGIFIWSKDSSFQWGDGNPSSNTSGSVTVTNTGTIKTYGVDSHGIIAESIGGGGGALTSYSNMKTSIYGAVTASTPGQSLGGYSGSADGYDVTVVNKGAISTYGGYASGTAAKSADGTNVDLGGGIAILAHSIGGGGGTNTGHGAIGGIGGSGNAGGDGSNGGTVNVKNYAALTTYGSEAHGIVAQSIGGGGGAGRNRKGLFVSVGGNGGNGGAGGTVDVLDEAAITLSGDYATGIIAQSIGGGGGAGGKATAWGVGFSMAIGGYGGYGGNGGSASVTTTSDGKISTAGTNALGILVQSIGGGGGSGGAAKSSSAGKTFDIAIASGGGGGGGGGGGDAYVKHSGSVTTGGYDSTGILVQSVGGGGGAGGASMAKSLAAGLPFDKKGDSFALSVSIAHGGSGGSGGSGGEAKAILEKDSSVSTTGDGSIGLHIQSIGGGGGAGGDSTAAASTATLQSVVDKLTAGQTEAKGDSVTAQLTFSLGGSGGDGGDGGEAYAHTYGAISTTGDFADGMLIQSIGGGGGAGGTGETDSVSTFGDSTFSLGLSIGGTAGDGGYGGEAIAGVADTGSVTTTGPNSMGLFVQSIGGGGGKGGGGSGDNDADNSLSVGAGATGGSGGYGGSVYAWNNGKIVTKGDASSGIVAQSVGGGGGQGGSGTSSIGHAFEFKKETEKSFKDWVKLNPGFDVTTKLTANTGASGGAGGDGGQVVVGTEKLGSTLSKGTTTTYGSFSAGVLAQSIGGGGGAVSVSSSVNDADLDVADADVDLDIATISFGASGGSAGEGGTVTVYAANTYTSGFSAPGVIAQSLGGGGGVGIVTGYAMDKISVSLGATSKSYGAASAVTVDTLAGTNIQTTGDNANGVIAQSIGGGGGLAGIALGTYDAVNDDTISDVISVEFGSDSGNGTSHGDSVTVDHAGSLTTKGSRSVGIVSQSISGGGGFVSASAASFDDVTFVQKQAPNSANDATVTVEGGASIVTSGDGAVGILAQTVAGGGGVAADLALGLTPFYSYYNKQTYGTSYYYDNDTTVASRTGDVTVTVDAGGTVSTTGKYAHGIVAQAIAGSGGIFTRDGKTYAGSLGRFNNTYDTAASGNSQSGSVSVTVDGSVTVADPTAWAIWAQATGEDLTVTVGSEGTVTGSQASGSDGKYAGGAIFVSGADKTTMTLDNSGTVTGNVVRYKFADDTEELQKATIASVTDGKTAAVAGQALFVNQGTGTFATGAIADVDAVLNAGTMDIGGEWNLIETTVTGDLVGIGTKDAGSAYDVASLGLSTEFSPFGYFRRSEQQDWRTATSSRGGLISGLDVDMEHGLADKLLVRGDFAGTWGVDVNANALLPNTRTEFLKVSGSDTSDLSILSSLVFDFTDVSTSPEDWTGFSVANAHFTNNGVSLGRNGRRVSSALQQAWNRIEDGSATEVKFGADEISLGQVFGAFHQSTPETFSDMLMETISQTAAAPLSSSPSAAISAANSVLSCPAFETSGVMMDESSCVWSRALGGETTQDSQGDAAGYTQSIGGLQIGGQMELRDGWFLGSGLTYESSWFRSDSGSQKLDQDSFVGAVALKKEVGPWLFGLVGGGGYNWGDSKRYINLDTLSATATGNPNSAMFFGRFRASYEFALGDEYYMRPRVDLDIINMHQYGYTERGAGALNLMVDDNSDTAFGVTPGIEFGARIPFLEDWPARLYGDLGVSFISADEWETTARFSGLSSMDRFSTFSPIADTVGHVTLGLDLAKRKGMELKLQYDGAFAEDYRSHTGSLRFGYRF